VKRQKRGSTLSGHRGRAERPRSNDVIAAPVFNRAPDLLGTALHDRHTIFELARAGGHTEELGATSRCIQPNVLGLAPEQREHKAGKTTTSTEVEDSLRGDSHSGGFQRVRVSPRVTQMGFERTPTYKTKRLRLGQDIAKDQALARTGHLAVFLSVSSPER